MKTILYSLIAIIVFGIIATGYTNKVALKNSILIVSTDSNISSDLLSQSAKIISNRLKSFSSEKFDITVNSSKNQIQVVLTNDWDLKAVENLLIQKGALAFYETYNHRSFAELLNGDNHLFSLLNSVDTNKLSVKIGCTSITDIDKVNDYLSTIGLDQKCKFAWRQISGNSEICLYALKLNSEKGALIVGSDIESVKSNQDKELKNFELEIMLKKSAIELWANATKRNINNAIAIVIDNNVLSTPIVNTVIDSGKCEITGDFTQSEVRYFAAIGNNGVLPVSFKVVR